MPTSFNTSFDDSGDDIIHASHVTQYAAPINALETAIDLKENVAEKGVAGGYAELDGTGKVPASQLPEPGASDLDDLTDVAVSGPMPGEVLKYNGTVFTNAALSTGDLPSHTHAISDVTNLQSSLDSKVNTSRTISTTSPLSGGGDLSVNRTLFIAKATASVDGYLAATDFSTFNGKQNALTAPSDVPGLTSALAAKEDKSQKGVAGGYASLDGTTGKIPVAQIPTAIPAANVGNGNVDNAEFDHLNGVTGGIQGQLDGKALAIHQHNATTDITAGTLGVARGGTGLGSLPANLLLGSGSTANVIQGITIGTGLSLSGGTLTNTSPATVSGSGSANRIAFWSSASGLSSDSGITRSGPNLSASIITTNVGQFNSGTSNFGFVASGNSLRASLQSDRTYLYKVRNVAGGQLMYWNTNGEITYQFSRGAHKEDVRKLDLSIDELMKWRPVEFKWKERFGGQEDVGFIAEEVAKVYPLAATYDQPWEYLDEKSGNYAVDHDGTPKRLEGDPV